MIRIVVTVAVKVMVQAHLGGRGEGVSRSKLQPPVQLYSKKNWHFDPLADSSQVAFMERRHVTS